MRYFIKLSYFGKAYHGWQKQPNALSVQAVLEGALSTLLRGSVEIVGAGRTDAGVHAKEMFAHFDFDELNGPETLVHRLNSFLPDDIAVKDIFPVPQKTHARFDAIYRTYEFCVVQEKNPFCTDYAHYVKYPLQLLQMNRSASYLLGQRDFECFSKSNTDVKTFLCDVQKAVWEQKGDKLVFTITADRFLRNMVRAIVGTLLEIGTGKRAVGDMNGIIEGKSRSEAGVSVPAKGLYLTRVLYPKTIFDEQK